MAGGMQAALKIEILLQINERLYSGGVISRDLYEQAKLKIVETAS